jgi:hypothetical protein
MGSFEWMEVETLSTEITALESRLAAAKSRHNYGLVKVVKEQIAAAQQRRARYLAHITTSLAESLESPAGSTTAPETPARQRAAGQKNRDEPAAPEPPSAKLADPVADEAQEELAEPEQPIADPVVNASETAAEPDPASLAPADPDTPDISDALATPDQPAPEPAAAPAEVPTQLADLDQPAAEPADTAPAEVPKQRAAPIARSGDASPNADTIEGVIDVWDQLTPTHIEHAKHELGIRRAEMLARHAEEVKALEADQSEINALAQAIDAFVRKFNQPSAASVVRLDEERDRLQNQA